MGFGERVRSWMSGEELSRTDDPSGPSSVERIIARAIEARTATFTKAEALTLPSLHRAVELLCSQGAILQPVAYRDGVALDPQPEVVARPGTIGRPYDFTYQTIRSLIEDGDAYWRVADRDFDGNPTKLRILDPEELSVTWDDRRIRPLYRWRDQELNADVRAGKVEVIHIALGRGPGELTGHSPIDAALARLATIAAAEEYAAAYYTHGGIPEVVLKSGVRLTKDEAGKLLEQYAGDGSPRPARVVSGDVTLEFPTADPARSQLQETRSHAATEVARLLGIPGPLLLIETSGATIVYQNSTQALNELFRQTLDPVYLTPIEQAWTDLVPRSTSVRYDFRELQVADIRTRADVEKTWVEMGALDPTEVRVLEGWPADPIATSPFARPTPPPRPVPIRQEGAA